MQRLNKEDLTETWMGFMPGDLGSSTFRQPSSGVQLRVIRVGVRLRPGLVSPSFLACGAVWV